MVVRSLRRRCLGGLALGGSALAGLACQGALGLDGYRFDGGVAGGGVGGTASGAGGDGPLPGGAGGTAGGAPAGGGAGGTGEGEVGLDGPLDGVGDDAGGPPVLLDISPADATADAGITTAVRYTFSEPLDPALPSARVSMTRGDGTLVSGNLSVESSALVFTPSAPLVLNGAYTLSLTGSLSDRSGDVWQGPVTSSFRTRDGAWGAPQNLAVAGDTPELAFDDAGNAVAIYEQSSSSDGSARLGLARFTPTAGWEELPPVPSTSGGPYCFARSVVAGPDGWFQLVWHSFDQMYSARYRDTDGVGPIGSGDGDRGDGLLLGAQSWLAAAAPFGVTVMASDAGADWSAPEQLFITDDGTFDAGPVLFADAVGDVNAVWIAQSSLLLSTRLDGAAWNTPTPLSSWSTNIQVASLVRASSALGHVLFAWEQSDPSAEASLGGVARLGVLLRGRDGGTSDASPDRTEMPLGNSFSPAVGMNARGDALLAWIASTAGAEDADAPARNWASFRSSTSSRWSAPLPLSPAGEGRARPPAVSVDVLGNGHAVWVEADALGAAQVHAARFSLEQSQFVDLGVISGATPVSAVATRGDATVGFNPRVVVDGWGRALAVWVGPGGGIWSARFE